MKEKILSVKPMNPTKNAAIEKLRDKMKKIFQEIEKVEKTASNENVVSILNAAREAFSENIENFNFLDINDKLLQLAQYALKAGVVCINTLKKNLEKGMASDDIHELLKNSGLLCVLVA